MKKKMSFADVVEFYETTLVEQTDKGFELLNDRRGFTTEIPGEFHMFLNGKVIDPTEMLVDRMGWMRCEVIKTLAVCAPVQIRYAFGRLVETEEGKRFCLQDPMESTSDSMEVCIEADWDRHQGVVNTGWIEEVEKNWGKYIYHQKTIPNDVYGISGMQVWILHVTESMKQMMKLKVDFYTWQRHTVGFSDEILKKFEAEKEKYRELMIDCLKGLPGRVHRIEVEKEEDLWPEHDANRVLWERREYDWQIAQFDDRLEVRGRGGSPGVISAVFPRCDEVGLGLCRKYVEQHT